MQIQRSNLRFVKFWLSCIAILIIFGLLAMVINNLGGILLLILIALLEWMISYLYGNYEKKSQYILTKDNLIIFTAQPFDRDEDICKIRSIIEVKVDQTAWQILCKYGTIRLAMEGNIKKQLTWVKYPHKIEELLIKKAETTES